MDNIFGNRLKDLRVSKNMTGVELGKVLSVTKVAISNWESGKRTPDHETLKKIADYFDVTTDYLLGRTDEKQPKKERFQNVNSISAHRIGKIEKLSEEALDQLDDYIQYLELKYKK